MSTIHDLVHRLGGTIYDGGKRANVPGPGHSRNDRSLALWTNSDGRVIFFSHAGDSVADIRAHLGIEASAESELSPRARAKIKAERLQAQSAERARKQRFCRGVWEAAGPLEGTLAARYLGGRGIRLSTAPPVLRFHPAAPRAYETERTCPAMLALVQDPEGQASGLHVTYLKQDGSWHDGRLMFGNCRGGAVRLYQAGAELAVAEGIESALSYAYIRARPTWALLSTSQFSTFQPPLQVDQLWVAPDMDDKLGTSLDLAHKMVQRIASAAVAVDAPPAGTDWNSHHRAGGGE